MPDALVHIDAPRMASKGTLSPKTILAAVVPTLGGLIAVAIEWAVTGHLDRLELTTALTAFGSALVAGLGAYVGAPGQVQVPAVIEPVVEAREAAA
jgi:hypothetical protein